MSEGRLAGKRVLVTQANDYMGPATVELFRKEGAEVIADTHDLTVRGATDEVVEAAGHVDVLVANLAADNAHGIPVTELDDDTFERMFEVMVYPLHRLVRAVSPQMIERGRGKVVVFGSATPLRGLPRLAAYSAARGAQVGFVRAVGVELARHNIQMNLIAQNYVESESYYPASIRENPKFQARLGKDVPLGRLARAEEDAAFALFLAGDESDFFVGQSIPFSGGWVT